MKKRVWVVRKPKKKPNYNSKEITEEVLKLWNAGMSVKEIQEQISLSEACAHSHLPYSKIIYKLDQVPGGERSVNADRQKLPNRVYLVDNAPYLQKYPWLLPIA